MKKQKVVGRVKKFLGIRKQFELMTSYGDNH